MPFVEYDPDRRQRIAAAIAAVKTAIDIYEGIPDTDPPHEHEPPWRADLHRAAVILVIETLPDE